MLIAALGGEGGGVLTNWLIEVADRSGWLCQSTSLAGVAQRTGATIYYLEFIRREDAGADPVLSLFPSQGDIDIAVTSEIAEAGRMLSRGFVSPKRTTLISSDHRVFGITEKSAITDGAIDTPMLIELAERYSKRFVSFNVDTLVKRHGTVISAGLLGAIAGAGVLPFDKAIFAEIVAGNGASTANMAAFEDSFLTAQRHDGIPLEGDEPAPFILPEPSSELGATLLPQIAALPPAIHEVCYHGAQRLVDYQDLSYAQQFLVRVVRLVERDSAAGHYELTSEAARWLALWMAFEDVPRVAQLKLRPEREASIREEVKAAPNQLLKVTEFFHPRVEEVAAMLPTPIGRWLVNSAISRRLLTAVLGPRKLRTDTIATQLVLRGLASVRHWRRATLGFYLEHQMIDRWFNAVIGASDDALALALADCGRMVKGYGATRHRTTTQLMAIIGGVEGGGVSTSDQVRKLYSAAMTQPDDQLFQIALSPPNKSFMV